MSNALFEIGKDDSDFLNEVNTMLFTEKITMNEIYKIKSKNINLILTKLLKINNKYISDIFKNIKFFLTHILYLK